MDVRRDWCRTRLDAGSHAAAAASSPWQGVQHLAGSQIGKVAEERKEKGRHLPRPFKTSKFTNRDVEEPQPAGAASRTLRKC